jgi:vacuolar-type H+-ATPase subunit H
MVEMPEKESKCILFKIIKDLKENSNKQLNEVRKPIQDLYKKVTNMDEKNIEILRGKTNGNAENEKLNKANKKRTGQYHQ